MPEQDSPHKQTLKNVLLSIEDAFPEFPILVLSESYREQERLQRMFMPLCFVCGLRGKRLQSGRVLVFGEFEGGRAVHFSVGGDSVRGGEYSQIFQTELCESDGDESDPDSV